MSKTGFSTLNRWLGRKNKEKTLANGKLSKSSNNLSISTNTINDSSQVEYNRITPLPVATTNAPFEQTFRITVLLPKDQLYVTRLGARTPLNKLLELICDNKSLDIEKYEFRNPADPSQIYDCELTIGAVGLSEIRLCHKSESYDTFNADEIIKLHRTSLIRDSLSSSSDFSSRISKHTTKTTSPYSSTNSLNSMDSCGLNYTRTPVIQPPLAAMALRKNSMASLTTARISPTPATVTSTTTTIMGKILAPPPRKKRTAPRPPKISPTSQNVIPEKTLNGDGDSLHRNDCEISDINGNIYNNGNQKVQHIIKNKREETEVEMEDEKIYESIDTNLNGYADDTVLYAQVQKKNAINHIQMNNGPDTGAAQNNFNSNDDGNDVVDNVNENCKKLPEPSPRKRIVQVKKKSAPAPPPRNSSSTYYNDNNNSKSSNIDEDTISLISTNIMASSTPTTPIKITPNRSSDSLYTKVQIINGSLSSLENEITKSQTSVSTLTSEKSFKVEPHLKQQTANEIVKELETKPKPIPRMTTTTLLNATDVDHNLKNLDVERENHLNMKTGLNISKVILNRTPTPEPCSLMSEPTKENFTYEQTEEDHGQQQQQQQEKKEDAEESEEQEHNITVEDDNVSKQADSGIGEPIPSPLPDSLPNSEISTGDCKSNFESSSDDDDLIKVYNFKLGKTLVKPLVESSELTEQPLEELTPLRKEANNVENVIQIEEVAARFQDQMQNKDDIKQKISSDANAWTFSIPISPPPTFADGKFSHNINEGETVKTDAPITPKITERPLLDFENIEKDGHSHTSLYKTEVNEGNKAKVVKNDYLNKEERNLQEDSKINKELNLNLIKQQNKTDAELLDKQRKCNKYNEFDKSMKVAWKVENSEALISPTAPLNGLLEELSSIINGQGVDSLVRNRSSDTTTIESAKPNTLENFSITNIKSQNMPKWREQRENSKTIIATTTTKITSTTNTTSKILTNAKSNKPATATTMNFQTTSITMEEEKLYRKRSNANNLKQRRSIARADSFHSTVSTLTMEDSNLQGRSSSQLALNKLDNGHNNGITRRSSSELSIGESPSLQSLEVIKTILRNHKNKPCNNNDNINNKSNEMAQEEVMVVRARRPSQELKFASLELKPKSGIEKITNTATSSTAIPTSSNCEIKKYKAQEEAEEEGEKDASTELAKLYRYSGRPSVNVGTWNERPKVQVSIKNEGDYIFGGKKVSSTSSSTFPLENYCKSMTAFTYQDATAGKYQNGIGRTTATRTTASSLFVPNTLKTKSATFNHRLSMPNHEFHNNNNTNNNIKVKPLRDVVYENEPINAKFIAKQKRPTVETVLRPQTQVIVNPSIIAAATTTTTITTAAAAPTNQYRIQQKRFSTPPNIINSNSNNSNNSKNSNNNNNQDNQNNITYSTSMKRNNHVPGGVEENKTIVAPFGQNTLRRTGLKEKFLAKESEQQQQQQQQQQQKIITKSNATNTSASIYIDDNDQENNNIEMSGRRASNTITMNLQKTFKEETILNNNKHNNNNNNINNNIKANNNYSNNHNNEKVSITITKPKPPSMLAFKQIQLKTVKADRTPTPSSEPEDTRDQLMAAIRNFNRTQLKKA